MRVLITGTSSGIGRATALKYLQNGFTVVGFDICPATIFTENYIHYILDVGDKACLPDFDEGFDIIINNAATADEDYAIRTNLEGYVNVAEKYAAHIIRSVKDLKA